MYSSYKEGLLHYGSMGSTVEHFIFKRPFGWWQVASFIQTNNVLIQELLYGPRPIVIPKRMRKKKNITAAIYIPKTLVWLCVD